MSNLVFEVVKEVYIVGGEEDLVARAKQQVQKIKREIKIELQPAAENL